MGKKRALKEMNKNKPGKQELDQLKVAYFKEKAKAIEIEQKTKPRTHKVKKLIERKEEILQNDPKHSVFMRGNNCSLNTQNAMRELHKMRDIHISKCLLQKKNEIYPFEDAGRLERAADRHDAGFIVFGSHNKKRPNNMIF
jgi:ribosome production factor 2